MGIRVRHFPGGMQKGSDLTLILGRVSHCCQAVWRHSIRHSSGRTNLSILAVENPPPGQAIFVAARSALVGLTPNPAVEFARQNIQVNLLLPSMTETDLTKHVPKVVVNTLKAETPRNRPAEAADITKPIVLLASSQASFTTGQNRMVIGGRPPLI